MKTKPEIKNQTIGVWEVQFFVADEDGQSMLDEKGNVRVFYSPHSDFSEMGLTEGLELSHLRDV